MLPEVPTTKDSRLPSAAKLPFAGSGLEPGFPDPVRDAQQVFRAALTVMSEPGKERLLTAGRQIAGLHGASYALLLALADADTPVWISPRLDHPALRANLIFHCNCPITAHRPEAALAVLDGEAAHDTTSLREFSVGDIRRPDRSCTLIVQLPRLTGGAPMLWRGPGIPLEHRVFLPLAEAFWQAREKRNAFPLGLDIFFTAGERLMGLPRTTHTQYSDEYAQVLRRILHREDDKTAHKAPRTERRRKIPREDA
ncbi:MAG: phosphonate C-P lyase system protein PhnH [Azoarcus sp.]|jgi:alpha-D-ribose 1-methylphosphonate 5-triphosphate synthase subunit PhnH|nr:phosphonate C-P lyase system protein PhnH [Azoarcus sp.]